MEEKTKINIKRFIILLFYAPSIFLGLFFIIAIIGVMTTFITNNKLIFGIIYYNNNFLSGIILCSIISLILTLIKSYSLIKEMNKDNNKINYFLLGGFLGAYIYSKLNKNNSSKTIQTSNTVKEEGIQKTINITSKIINWVLVASFILIFVILLEGYFIKNYSSFSNVKTMTALTFGKITDLIAVTLFFLIIVMLTKYLYKYYKKIKVQNNINFKESKNILVIALLSPLIYIIIMFPLYTLSFVLLDSNSQLLKFISPITRISSLIYAGLLTYFLISITIIKINNKK